LKIDAIQQTVGVLSPRLLHAGPDLRIARVDCRGHGEAGGEASAHSLVVVRRGCFTRTTRAGRAVLHPGAAYVATAGEEEWFAHPASGGDVSTVIALSPARAALLQHWADAPGGAVAGGSACGARRHLDLLVAIRHGADADEVGERAFSLVESLAGDRDRPSARRDDAELADAARLALARDPGLTLKQAAGALAVSPSRLSRAFHAAAGTPFTKARQRLRVSAALDRLADGERNLARLAADLGFSDHAHMTRIVRRELGATPSALRRALGDWPSAAP
jgi:AraC-like DNA-binding protein